jgi:peroxiredoxin
LACWFAAGSYLHSWGSTDRPSSAQQGRAAQSALSADLDELHFVTPAQLAASGAATGESFRALTAMASDGRQLTWPMLSGGKMVVFVFIKDGCPCSVRFEPFFHRIAAAFEGRVRFVGVIDGSVDVARDYVAKNKVPYPVLADPDHTLISQFKALNAAYVALVDPQGALNTLWPGCSAEMMQDLCRRISAAAGGAECHVDFAGMPGPLTTGCPFF